MRTFALLLLVTVVSGRGLFAPVTKKCGNLVCDSDCVGNCCSSSGECPSSACPANGLGSNLQNCNDNTCSGWVCDKTAFNEECYGSDSHCLGKVVCTNCDYNGEVCFYDGVSNNFKVCGEVKPPVDCVLSDWGSWGQCVSGVQTRNRTVVTEKKYGGKDCDTTLTETKKCSNPLLDNSGCGPQLSIYNCKLDTTQTETVCVLPFGLGEVKVPTIAGYTRMRFRINARGEYKPT
jgi:hypothetical protein